jgi:hypothetical protein
MGCSQRLIGGILYDQIGRLVMDAKVVDTNDMRMVSEGPCLSKRQLKIYFLCVLLAEKQSSFIYTSAIIII